MEVPGTFWNSGRQTYEVVARRGSVHMFLYKATALENEGTLECLQLQHSSRRQNFSDDLKQMARNNHHLGPSIRRWKPVRRNELLLTFTSQPALPYTTTSQQNSLHVPLCYTFETSATIVLGFFYSRRESGNRAKGLSTTPSMYYEAFR